MITNDYKTYNYSFLSKIRIVFTGMLIIMDWRELLSGKLTLTTSSETLARKNTPSPKPLPALLRAAKVLKKTNSLANLRKTGLAPLRLLSVIPPTIPRLFQLCQPISPHLQQPVCDQQLQQQLSISAMRSTVVEMETWFHIQVTDILTKCILNIH